MTEQYLWNEWTSANLLEQRSPAYPSVSQFNHYLFCLLDFNLFFSNVTCETNMTVYHSPIFVSVLKLDGQKKKTIKRFYSIF